MTQDEMKQQGELFFKNMPEGLLLRLQYFAENLDIPLWQVAHNLLIDQYARTAVPSRRAKRIVPRAFLEFQGVNNELVTGERLFRNLLGYYALEAEETEKRLRSEGPIKEMKEKGKRYVTPKDTWKLDGTFND